MATCFQNVSNNKEFGNLGETVQKVGNIVLKLKNMIWLPPVVTKERNGAFGFFWHQSVTTIFKNEPRDLI